MKLPAIIFALLICMLQSCIVSSKPNIDYFNQQKFTKGQMEFVSINVPTFLTKSYVNASLKGDKDSKELRAIIKKIKKLKVLTIENANQETLAGFTQHLKDHRYQDWMTINSDKDHINIQAIQDGDGIKNLMLVIQSDADLVLVDIKGRFTPEDISAIINQRKSKQTQN